MKLSCRITPETLSECNRTKCHRCQEYLEGTIASRFFASKFEKDRCWKRINFPPKGKRKLCL